MKHSLCLLLLVFAVTALADPRDELVIETVAGTGAPENNGDAGPAGKINVGQPFGVELGPDGALYITEVMHHRIRRLDLASNALTTIAGCGTRGYAGDGGPAVEARLNEPYEVRFDRRGNMYFVELRNHVVHRVDTKTQVISTIAGNGRQGFGGDGGPAVRASLNQPHSIALDGDHALYIADIGNHRIRRIDLKSGTIESIAGNLQRSLPRDGQVAHGNPILGPRALFVHDGTLWIALREGHSVWRMSLADGILRHVAGSGEAGLAGDGGPAADAKLNGPKGIAVGPNGDAFVVDSGNNRIRRINAKTKSISSVSGTRLEQPHGICVAGDGSLYVGDTLNHKVVRVR